VIGRVDRFIAIDVGSRVGEVGLHLGIGKLNEGTVPKHTIGGFLTHHADLVFVFFAQTMIHLDKNILRTSLACPDVGQKGRDLALDEIVGDRDGAFFVFDILEGISKP
jgi:hypothetical protein